VVAQALAGEKAILCATDPPYGVDFAGAKYNPRAKQWAGIEGDKRTGTDLREWLGAGIAVWVAHCREDAAFYFWCAAMTEGAAAAAAITDAGLHIQSQIIWVKNALVLGQADYHWRHENCWYAFKKGAKHRWLGERDKTTVWEVKKVASADYEHPMQKPVELYATAIRNHTYPGELCFEPFSGSGTQILACEQLQRNCVAIEVHPPFVQVAIDRWEAFTGKTAVKAGEAAHP
jgi:DNA modification methylase